jgi:hypothetical protein
MRKTPTPPATTAAQAQLAALTARLREIKTSRDADNAELVRRDKSSGGVSPAHTEATRRTRAARELLNGAAVDLLPPLPDEAGSIEVLKEKIRTADAALEEGGRLIAQLQYQAGVERFRARADDVRACMAGISAAVVGLELALQKRDALLKEIKPPVDLIPGAGWVFLGRVGRSESQAYRFLQAAASAGWITNDRFRAEVDASRKTLS